jgi:hypothetical protein
MPRKATLFFAAGLALLAIGVLAAGALVVWQVRFRRPPVFNGDLAFETLERDRAPDVPARYFPRAEPGLLVLTSRQDIGAASGYMNYSATQQLLDLDWDENFAIVVLRGYQTHSVAGFAITRVARQDGEVGVYASTGPIGEETIPTSPYHVIAVRKVGVWGGPLTFRLYVDALGEMAQVVKAVPESTVPQWPR